MTEAPTKITLSENQVEAITYIEQCYYLHGSLPTDEALADVIGVSVNTVKGWWKNDSVQLVLRNKGLPVDERVSGRRREVLTPQQLAVANMVLNLQDRRSLREKLEEAGITVQKYQIWRRDPVFMDYVQKRAQALFSSGSDSAYMNLMKNVEGGSLDAAKLFFEMTGIYNPKISVELNVDAVLVRVIEIIQRRVKDPATMEAIALDIEALVSGQPREIVEPVIEVKETQPALPPSTFSL